MYAIWSYSGVAIRVREICHKIDFYMGPGPMWNRQWHQFAYREVTFNMAQTEQLRTFIPPARNGE